MYFVTKPIKIVNAGYHSKHPPPLPIEIHVPVHVISSSFCSCNFQQKTNEMVQLKRKVTAPCALLWYKFQNISFFCGSCNSKI